MAAEQKARAVYENLMNLTDDPDVLAPLSYLRQREFKAYVFSGEVSDCKKVIQRELEEKRTNIVGFYAAADNIRIVGNFIKWIKNTYPDCKTIIGGPQAAGLDYSFFSKTKNDYAIIGEGEIPMYQLLSVLVDGIGDIDKIPSLVRVCL